jgi:RimJ/RimL family protein N-acetyltransferase
MQLTAPRVLLREFSQDDLDALTAIHSDPRVQRYYAPEVGTPEHTRMLVEMFMQWATEKPRRSFQLAIVDRATAEVVGSCGIRGKSASPGKAEFGIGIGSSWWGKGVGYEAASTILNFGFDEVGLAEVHAVTVAENEAVARFMKRLGFASGAARLGETWIKERNWHALDWAITRETWNGRHPAT